jgi:hypothetical protein
MTISSGSPQPRWVSSTAGPLGSALQRSPHCTWGGLGKIFRLPDIVGFVSPDGREAAEERLAARRRSEAAAILKAGAEQAAASA